jgi:hypothetical protein
MLTPAQLVFDFFAGEPQGFDFSRDQIKTRLAAFPKTHIDGAISQLKSAGKLTVKDGKYQLVEGVKRPPAQPHSIDYHDTSSRGFEALEMSRNSKIYQSMMP